MVDTVSPADPHSGVETILMTHAGRAGLLSSGIGLRHLEALPVGLFGSVASLAVLSLAWRLTHTLYGTPIWIAEGFLALAELAFVLLALGYGAKLFVAPGAVRAEFRDPATGPIFATVPISLLLLPIGLAPISPALAKASWVLGAGTIIALSWLMANRLFSGSHSSVQPAPSWIIPAVGLMDIPLAMPSLDVPPMHGLAAFGFGVGMFLSLLFVPLLIGRSIFNPPLPNASRPSILILIAPFATGFATYVSMMRSVDLFSKSLYLIMAFLLAVLIPRLRQLGQCCPLTVSWWAVGFPLATACLPALHFARTEVRLNTKVIAIVLLSIATVTSAQLFWQTIARLVRGKPVASGAGSKPAPLRTDSIAAPLMCQSSAP